MIARIIRFIRWIIKQPNGIVVLGCLFFLVALPFTFASLQTLVGFTKFKLRGENLFDDEFGKLQYLDSGVYEVLGYVNEYVLPAARILTFRQSDIGYYTRNPIAVQLDPEYLSLFTDTISKRDMTALLMSEGVRYVYLPNYVEPAIFASTFESFLADPAHVELIFYAKGARLYRILAPDERNEISVNRIYSVDFDKHALGPQGWNFFRKGRFLSRDPSVAVSHGLSGSASLQFAENQGLGITRQSRIFATGAGHFKTGLGSNAISVQPASELRLCLTNVGAGYFSFFVHEYDRGGRHLQSSPAWNTEANPVADETCFFVRSGIKTHALRLELQIPGFSDMQLEKLTLDELIRPSSTTERNKAMLLSSGWRVRDEHYRVDSEKLSWNLNSDTEASLTIHGRGSSDLVISTPITEVPAIPQRMTADISGLGRAILSADWVCADSSLAWQMKTAPTTLTGSKRVVGWDATSSEISPHPKFVSSLADILWSGVGWVRSSSEREQADLALWTPDPRNSCGTADFLRGQVHLTLQPAPDLFYYTSGENELTLKSITLDFEDGSSIVLAPGQSISGL